MAETPDLSVETEHDTDLVRQLRAELRNQAETRKQAETRAEQAEKRATFQTLGINPNQGVGKLFYEAYKGELTEDAVKAAAQEYELPIGPAVTPTDEAPAPTTTTQTVTTPEEQAAHQAMNGAAAGATASTATVDPSKAGWDAYQAALQTTGSGETAMAAHFGAKLKAAAEEQMKRRG